MKITILGAGALGGYFGARFQTGGHEVTYVARGAHLEAMQTSGLTLESPSGNIHLDKVHAVATLAEARPADLVFFALKNYDVAGFAETLPDLIGPETRVVTVQNGVTAPRLLAERIGADRVLPGSVYMPADLRAPGVVRVTAELQGLILGAFDGPPDARTRALVEALAVGGARVTLSEDIWRTLWQKFSFLSAIAAITTVTRLDLGPIRETPATRALLRELVDEACAVARAAHPSVSADIADTTFDSIANKLAPTIHASMLDDLTRGKRLELDWITGEMIRQGEALGIPTPAHAFAYAALAPCKDGPPSP